MRHDDLTTFQMRGENDLSWKDDSKEGRRVLQEAIEMWSYTYVDQDYFGVTVNIWARILTHRMWRSKFGTLPVPYAGSPIIVRHWRAGKPAPYPNSSQTLAPEGRTCNSMTLRRLREVIDACHEYTVQEYAEEASIDRSTIDN